jgi:formylglycine-generating enzyme
MRCLHRALAFVTCVMVVFLGANDLRGQELTAASTQRWAVLVGVNEYAQLRDLRYCVADAKKMRDRLIGVGFPPENIFLLVDDAERKVDQPFRENIQQRILSLLSVAEKDDLVLVMFSGHGVHVDGKGYFCPTDANLESPETTMVPLDFIYRQLESSAARQKLLLVDACRNDPRPPGSRDARTHELSLKSLSAELKTLPEGILALSSSAAGQISWEDDELGHGVFLHFLMEGMSGKGVAGETGPITLLTLYNYANLETKRWVLRNRPGYVQTPELLGKITGDFELGRREPPPWAIAPFDLPQAESLQKAWSSFVNRPIELTDSVGIKFRLVPPGEFTMGSSESPPSRDERPRRVRITKPFYVAKYEVTRGQFAKFVTSERYRTTLERSDNGLNRGWNPATNRFEQARGFSWRNPGWSQDDDHPVVNVSWQDAQQFVEWMSRQENARYRLLTEAEWEYCCRAGTTTTYATGNDPRELTRVANVLDQSGKRTLFLDPRFREFSRNDVIERDDGVVFTSRVGAFESNNFGLYDFHGNVCEWCSDWYHPSYGNVDEADPQGAAIGQERSARGGRFDTGSELAKSYRRNRGPATMSDMILGFRVARDLE